MKIFFKFLISLISLPFLIPWFLADKAFEFFFQPIIFKRYKLEISRRKVWVLKIIKILIPVLLVFYLVIKIFGFFDHYQSFWIGLKNLNWLFAYIYNSDVRKILVFLFTPLNRLIYYLRGGNIFPQIGNFFAALFEK